MSPYCSSGSGKRISHLPLEDGRALKGLAEEYGISNASISI